jgi:hypothetical protein
MMSCGRGSEFGGAFYPRVRVPCCTGMRASFPPPVIPPSRAGLDIT